MSAIAEASTTDDIVLTEPRALLADPLECEVWRYRAAPGGFTVEPGLDLTRLPATDREAIEADMAALPDDDFWSQPPLERAVFPTLADAQEYAALCDEDENVDTDMRAFNAPSECGVRAHRDLEQRISAVLERAVRVPA